MWWARRHCHDRKWLLPWPETFLVARTYGNCSLRSRAQVFARRWTRPLETVRMLTGWNVFQREMLKTKQISQQEWKHEIRKLSAQWRALSIEEKQNYNLKARYEQGCRDELARRPLGTRTGTDLYQPYMHAGPGDHELGQDDGDGGMAHRCHTGLGRPCWILASCSSWTL